MVADDEPDRTALPTHSRAARWEHAIILLALALAEAGLLADIDRPKLLPNGTQVGSHLSDIGRLLCIAGAPS